jgi:hypothetical protein
MREIVLAFLGNDNSLLTFLETCFAEGMARRFQAGAATISPETLQLLFMEVSQVYEGLYHAVEGRASSAQPISHLFQPTRRFIEYFTMIKFKQNMSYMLQFDPTSFRLEYRPTFSLGNETDLQFSLHQMLQASVFQQSQPVLPPLILRLPSANIKTLHLWYKKPIYALSLRAALYDCARSSQVSTWKNRLLEAASSSVAQFISEIEQSIQGYRVFVASCTEHVFFALLEFPLASISAQPLPMSSSILFSDVYPLLNESQRIALSELIAICFRAGAGTASFVSSHVPGQIYNDLQSTACSSGAQSSAPRVMTHGTRYQPATPLYGLNLITQALCADTSSSSSSSSSSSVNSSAHAADSSIDLSFNIAEMAATLPTLSSSSSMSSSSSSSPSTSSPVSPLSSEPHYNQPLVYDSAHYVLASTHFAVTVFLHAFYSTLAQYTTDFFTPAHVASEIEWSNFLTVVLGQTEAWMAHTTEFSAQVHQCRQQGSWLRKKKFYWPGWDHDPVFVAQVKDPQCDTHTYLPNQHPNVFTFFSAV